MLCAYSQPLRRAAADDAAGYASHAAEPAISPHITIRR
jgi:hypothetical protein